MKLLFCTVFLLLIVNFVFGQTNTDSFERAVNTANNDTVKINLLIQLSELYLKTEPKKALEFAQKSEDICKQRANDKYTANTFKQLALSHLELFNKDETLKYAEKAISIYQHLNDDFGLSDCYNIKGSVFSMQTEYTKAIEFFNLAINIADRLNYHKCLSLNYSSLGMTYYKVDNLDKAFEYFNKALKTDSIYKNQSGLARDYNNLGMFFDQKGNYEKSLENYNKAYLILLNTDNKSILAKLLTNIGTIYLQMKDYTKALENNWKSIKIKKEIHDDFGIANNYNNIGVIFAQKKLYDSTLYYMQSALEIYTKLNDKRNIAMSFGNLGGVYRYMGNETEALKYLNKAIKLRLEISDIKGAGRSYLSIGYLYNDKKNLQQALQYFKNAMECGEKSGDERLKMESYMRISEMYEKQNNAKLALEYFKKYHNAFDTIYSHQKQKQILELQTKYETAQKDAEIKILNNTNEINTLNLERTQYLVKRQRNIIFAVLFITLLLAVFSIIFYRLFKDKRIANKQLKEKQHEIEQQNHEISSQRDALEQLNKELEIQKQKVTEHRDVIAEELKKTLLSSEILQRENLLFKFEALKNQLNPHFLFNTFSTLINLIPTNTELAEQYTRTLSSVYRYILTGKDKELVKLSEEIEFINAYIFLVSIRFNDNVKIQITIDEDKYNYYLPLLSLQLLVENAVKHNIISTKKPLLITIKNNNNRLIVENNLQKKSSLENSTKIGLQNIINRYQIITNEKVDIIQTETHFTVELPLLKENSYL